MANAAERNFSSQPVFAMPGYFRFAGCTKARSAKLAKKCGGKHAKRSSAEKFGD